MTRLETIETRLAEIEKELNSEEIEAKTEEDLSKMEEEVRSLKAEKTSIMNAAAKRSSLEKEIAEGRSGVDVTTNFLNNGGKKEMQERTFDAASAEYRSAWAKSLMGQELNEVEKRAYAQADAAVPTTVANQFFEKMKKLAPMLDEITLMRVAGNVKFFAEGVRTTAGKHVENAEIGSANDKMVAVTLGAFEFAKVVSISESAKAMSVDAFESWITDMLAGDIARAIDNYIINDETNGIAAIDFVDGTTQISATSAYTYANVMALIALLPASYDPDAKFLVNKRVLWNDIKGIVDDHKRPIFDPIEKTLCGYPVIVDDYVDAADKGLYLGYWKDIVGNLSKDIEVASNPHSGFTRAAIDYRGLAIFDSKPAKTDAIVRLVTTA